MTKTKFISLAAAISLALTFTSCGGSKPAPEPSTSPRIELLKIANTQYAQHYVGIGQYTSNSERVAANASAVDARNQLAIGIGSEIVGLAKLNAADADAKAAEAYMDDILEKVKQSLTNVRIQDIRMEKEQDNYKIYTLVTVPKDDALRTVKKLASTEEAIGNALGAKAIMNIIDSELDKYR